MEQSVSSVAEKKRQEVLCGENVQPLNLHDTKREFMGIPVEKEVALVGVMEG